MNYSVIWAITILILGLVLTLAWARQNPTHPINPLVLNYHTKPSPKRHRMVLVVESFASVDALVELVENILSQTIRVASITVVSQRPDHLRQVPLLHQTCTFSRASGLSALFKETSGTLVVFISKEGFHHFQSPTLLETIDQRGVTAEQTLPGIVLRNTDMPGIDLTTVYRQQRLGLGN
ncbi:hypothetical protein MIV025R [Invertebrate iridescent virus 3]|uniref:Uncharacterized protein 025R n=1 Tax=Invertebrate iridescent virus 3 TaxID=345201 RepID=025R_IIV3|nr:hypothetical protein MIV025R [Invertebrate iridescent virus 3]Q197D5.1 RecName: Full=Uncharacterized protein 025R; Flags: Precursor [Invertebrate iridescent virus 3]ABF82055.1 hypothetical protein MIV025R [Invertebrate iridescent virus 3]